MWHSRHLISTISTDMLRPSVSSGPELSSAESEGRRLGPDRYIEVDYEDLLRDPRAELMRIC